MKNFYPKKIESFLEKLQKLVAKEFNVPIDDVETDFQVHDKKFTKMTNIYREIGITILK